MSYLALARKWRPSRFNEVVGQAHVLTALENALTHNRLHHAYLFSGTRGVGKTTIGRLFAKGLNCETGITATPCGECATCKEIDEGRFVDLLEIDAASRTKVEDTRELLDNVQYKPARGRFKVYLIDEVHMLSRHSFNALLKTLEEPPEYVKFLLATTDPQKLPVTILSRCLQFHLKPISVDDIHQQLDHVLAAENVKADARALGMIAHAADGSMRDALSLTDQAIALGNGSVLTDSVTHMLGTLDTDQALHLLDAISHKQTQSVLNSVQTMAQNGVEWDGLLQQLAAQLHRIALYQALPATLDKTQPDSDKIEMLSRVLLPQDVQLYYQIAIKGREDLPLAPSERTGLEMVLLRMIAFRPVEHAAQRISVETSTEERSAPQRTNPSPTAPVSIPPSAPLSTLSESGIPPRAPETPASSHVQSRIKREVNQPDVHHHTHGEDSSRPSVTSHPAPQTPESPLTGLRHQLRSQRRGLKANGDSSQAEMKPTMNAGTSAKKPKAAPEKPTSVLERVVQQHGQVRMSPTQLAQSVTTTEPEQEEEAYRWKPSRTEPVSKIESTALTPTEIKQALAHEKTPEMTQKLVAESIQQDPWSALIDQLNISKLVEQLALNSAYRKDGSTIELALRSHQAHLNTDKAQQELLQALNDILGEHCHLSVSISDAGVTPLEVRDRLYQEKLQHAFSSLENDPHLQFIERRFSAQLDRDSVRPI